MERGIRFCCSSQPIVSTEDFMSKLRKISASLAAIALVTAPVAASAASGARATSMTSGENDLGGNASWIIGLIGLLAGVTAAIIIDNDDDDEPVSA